MNRFAPALPIACIAALLVGCATESLDRRGPASSPTRESFPLDDRPWQPLPGLVVAPRDGTRDVYDSITVALTSSRPFTITARRCDVQREPGTYRASRRIVVSSSASGQAVKLYAPRAGIFILWIEVHGLDEPLSLFYTVRAARGAPDSAWMLDGLRPAVVNDDVNELRSIVDRWPWEPEDSQGEDSAERPAGSEGNWDSVWRTADPSGRTLLLMAAAMGAERVTGFCVDAGVDVDQTDASGMTALMLASRAGHAGVVRLLREKDADPDARSAEGLSALDYAQRRGDSGVVELLRDESYARRVGDPEAWAGEWQGHAYSFFGSSRLAATINVVDGMPRGILSVTTCDSLTVDRTEVAPETLRYALRIFAKRGDVYIAGARTPDSTLRREESPRMRANLVSPVLMSGVWSESDETSVFYMEKKDRTMPPANAMARGKVLTLASTVFPDSHYTCYVPTSYDPRTPVPLVVFDNAAGKAGPLEPAVAEELGLVSVGLMESTNANTAAGKPWMNEVSWLAALVDVRHRLSIDDRRIYYAGFSGGALRSHARAICFDDWPAAGVLDIGMGLPDAPSHGVPTFYIMGARDTAGSRFIASFADLKAQFDGLVALRVHSGGHEWRVRSALAEGLRWLLRK